MSEFATYDDVMEMMDDRDDSNDPEFRDYDGYCEHGVYVGGCGIDWMCQWCEDGISLADAKQIRASERRRVRREAARRRLTLRMKLAELGYLPSEVVPSLSFWKQV